MVGKPKFDQPAAGPDNQFVRDALLASSMTQEALAAALEKRGLGNYTKSKIGKMARTQKVRAVEVAAISQITGVAIPEAVSVEAMRDEISEIVRLLETWRPDRLEAVRPVLGTLRNVPADRYRDVRVMLEAFLGLPKSRPPSERRGPDMAEDPPDNE